MKKLFLFFTFPLFYTGVFSQNNDHKIDSLETFLKNDQLTDSLRLKGSYELAKSYLNSNNEKTIFYTNQTIALVEFARYFLSEWNSQRASY